VVLGEINRKKRTAARSKGRHRISLVDIRMANNHDRCVDEAYKAAKSWLDCLDHRPVGAFAVIKQMAG
jgi:hypothetical protein